MRTINATWLRRDGTHIPRGLNRRCRRQGGACVDRQFTFAWEVPQEPSVVGMFSFVLINLSHHLELDFVAAVRVSVFHLIFHVFSGGKHRHGSW